MCSQVSLWCLSLGMFTVLKRASLQVWKLLWPHTSTIQIEPNMNCGTLTPIISLSTGSSVRLLLGGRTTGTDGTSVVGAWPGPWPWTGEAAANRGVSGRTASPRRVAATARSPPSAPSTAASATAVVLLHPDVWHLALFLGAEQKSRQT